MLEKILNTISTYFTLQTPTFSQIEGKDGLEFLRLKLENKYKNVGVFDSDSKIATIYKNGKMGYIHSSGKIILPLSSVSLKEFSEHKGIISQYIDDKLTIDIINEEGETLKRFVNYNLILPFKNNYSIVANNEEYYGKMNAKWELVIPCIYNYMKNINDDAILISFKDEWGVINNSNEFIVKPKFSAIEYIDFKNKKVIGHKEEGFGIYDFEGEIFKILDQNTKIESIYIDGKHYKEREGRVVIKNNLNENEFSLVDTDFNTVVPFGKYLKISDINEGMIMVAENYTTNKIDNRVSISKYGKCGFLNLNGELVIPMKFDFAGYFNEDVSVVSVNNKYGYIDKKGDFIIKPIYDYCLPFRNGLAKVKIGEQFYIIDKTGRTFLNSKSY